MENNFLKLVPQEGRQYIPDSALVAAPKPEGQNHALRRVAPVADLKTKVINDSVCPEFLKLTPDPPKKVVTQDDGISGQREAVANSAEAVANSAEAGVALEEKDNGAAS